MVQNCYDYSVIHRDLILPSTLVFLPFVFAIAMHQVTSDKNYWPWEGRQPSHTVCQACSLSSKKHCQISHDMSDEFLLWPFLHIDSMHNGWHEYSTMHGTNYHRIRVSMCIIREYFLHSLPLLIAQCLLFAFLCCFTFIVNARYGVDNNLFWIIFALNYLFIPFFLVNIFFVLTIDLIT